MSDQILSNAFKPPAELLQQLKDSEAQLQAMKKIMDGLKDMGWPVTEMEQAYSTVLRSRDVLLKTFGM
jgi:hypothetical protein